MLFELAIIGATVSIMFLSMSFIAAWLYYPYHAGFHIGALLCSWLRLLCFNFPFAFFMQIFLFSHSFEGSSDGCIERILPDGGAQGKGQFCSGPSCILPRSGVY